MKKKKKILLAVSFLPVVVIIVMLSNPLLRSEKTQHKKIMKDTPLGIKMEDVLNYIESKNWERTYLTYDQGLWDFGGYPPYGTAKATSTGIGGTPIIGTKGIGADLGGYRIVFAVDVEVFWHFNEKSELIYVQVRKMVDSI